MSFSMNIMHSTSSFVPLKPLSLLSPSLCTLNNYPESSRPNPSLAIKFPLTSQNPSFNQFSIRATKEETASVFHFEDIVEKDWSFLDNDGEHVEKFDQIICAGNIKETSKVLVSIGSEAFVDRVVESSPCEQLLVVHDSLLVLACIKEKYDKVKCWQGELLNVTEKWTDFDVVFLYFLPAFSSELDQVLGAIAKRCLPGARVVISHPQGRKVAEEQKQQYPDIVVSNLPEGTALQKTASDHGFEVVEFKDEPGFYLAVLRRDAKSGK